MKGVESTVNTSDQGVTAKNNRTYEHTFKLPPVMQNDTGKKSYTKTLEELQKSNQAYKEYTEKGVDDKYKDGTLKYKDLHNNPSVLNSNGTVHKEPYKFTFNLQQVYSLENTLEETETVNGTTTKKTKTLLAKLLELSNLNASKDLYSQGNLALIVYYKLVDKDGNTESSNTGTVVQSAKVPLKPRALKVSNKGQTNFAGAGMRQTQAVTQTQAQGQGNNSRSNPTS
ncbi:hypothetical protein PAM_110 [Onion yellows phytoplasma OY-M]|uniref:Uncharacterized protein n=1 Tax=Onion yellows phytoplasma (strain OY-M) TaxID=262768 RepID=Q6YRA5_ONYPE|nr:hypothetical protein PAM_110 [Onion yellows phytoplasma OY-M]